MKTFLIHVLLCVGSILLASAAAVGTATSKPASDYVDVYEVNKKVRDFPDEQDFSTPQAAYAVINRVMATGQESAWRQISVKQLASRLPAADALQKLVPSDVAAMWLDATVIEVRIFMGLQAVVIARLTESDGQSRFDVRSVRFQQGRWLNEGQTIADTLEGAREIFARKFARYVDKPARPKIDDPDAWLKRFVDFLQSNGREPKPFVLDLLAKSRLVLMGEIHHRPRYWAFNSTLVANPAFAERVGVIYLELPANDQDFMDRFLAAEELDTQPAIDVLRDMMVMGWPDQAMLDFMVTVWKVNRDLPAERKLRIVLADVARPWKEMREPADMRKFDIDRDRFMADTILHDLRAHPADKRAGLFIVGAGHAMLDLQYFDGTPITSAGYHLQKELGRDKVAAVFPHTCICPNVGPVEGRLCRGLFDSAFAAFGHKPVAFPLTTGPFGEQLFDAFPDRPVANRYQDGYDAYLYLGPLEDEVFSSLIPGFYTDEFVREVDRRYRLSSGKGWADAIGGQLDAQSITDRMNQSWGQPRKEWSPTRLGPMDAWRHPDK